MKFSEWDKTIDPWTTLISRVTAPVASVDTEPNINALSPRTASEQPVPFEVKDWFELYKIIAHVSSDLSITISILTSIDGELRLIKTDLSFGLFEVIPKESTTPHKVTSLVSNNDLAWVETSP